MVILKENEIQLSPNGATIKADKQEIGKWKKNIDEYFESLNYRITIKELNNNLISQHTYCSESNRLVFEFHATGRVVMKTKHRQTSNTFYGESRYYCGHKITNHREIFTYYTAFKTLDTA